MKTCIRCGDSKPLDGYYAHPQMADGHLNKCKACCRAEARHHHGTKSNDPEWVEAQRRRGREKYHRLYRSTVRERVSQTAPDPLKRAARVKLGNAVRDGRVTKPERCQECGALGRIEGHHTDYAKALDVLWLCTMCHGQRHRKDDAA